MKALKIEEGWNRINLTDDQPKLLFGPEVEGKYQDGTMPPFYIGLYIHDMIIHNIMFDFGASHNLMPIDIMEELGLSCTNENSKNMLAYNNQQQSTIGEIKDTTLVICAHLEIHITWNI